VDDAPAPGLDEPAFIVEGGMTMPDAVTELLSLRAWVLHMASAVEALGELPARKRGPEAERLAERMRHAVSAQHLVDACKR
jgi:hypothetical protein